MIDLLFIAAGGALGAVLRYLASSGVYRLLGEAFPYGTLFVNVSGSMVMGFLYIYLLQRDDIGMEWRAGLLIGLLGAFTTFSTFSFETLGLMAAGEQIKAGLNVLLSVVLCVSGCWLGIILGRHLYFP